MALPNPSMSFTPFDTLPAADLNDLVENIEYIYGLLTGVDPSGADGFNFLAIAPTSVTYLGNRSYQIVYNGADYTTLVSPATRFKTTRGTNAPVQCALLNGSNQYFNNTSVNKMTFTDDFVVSAWIKLSSYANSIIVSRHNGTSGWYFQCNANGQIALVGTNAGGANFSQLVTTQAIPLNRWVHVTAQLDMSSFTNTATTSYVMFDDVDVPATVSRGGTNPTALVQAGNLEVGSYNGGSLPFPGKIAQVAVFNAKVTQTQMRTYASQGLTGSETSLASAYSLSNSQADLNTTTPNNLSAQNSAATTNADSPFGQQADGSISATKDYSIVMMATLSGGNTTFIVQVPEGNTIDTRNALASIHYSLAKAPHGFPAETYKWTLETMTTGAIPQVVTSTSAWLNIAGMAWILPVGKWNVQFRFNGAITASSVGILACRFTLSTATTTRAYLALSATSPVLSAAMTQTGADLKLEGALDIATATIHYLNAQPGAVSGTTTAYIGSDSPGEFRFVNALL